MTLKKEDFKNILPVHFESCRQFIENNNGECNYVLCKDCPFYEENEAKFTDKGCAEKYPDLIKAAKEFLRFKKEMKRQWK